MVQQVSALNDQRDADPVEDLINAVAASTAGWLERCVTETALVRSGRCDDDLVVRAAAMATGVSPVLVAEITELLRTDVDEQRHNPLMLYRAAVVHPTRLLLDAQVPAAVRDEFLERVFAEDRYGLSPATWADVDERLREPGLRWGAWKAAVVLHRRRAEGRR